MSKLFLAHRLHKSKSELKWLLSVVFACKPENHHRLFSSLYDDQMRKSMQEEFIENT